MQPETLAVAQARKDVVVLDCRHVLADPEAGLRDYRQSHLPGAQFAHVDADLSRHSGDPSDGRHPWPDADVFLARLGGWGISPRHQVVAYDQGEGAFAARLWFLLRALGHGNVAVLDGGWKRWTTLGLPVDSAVATRPPEHYPSPGFEAARLLDADAVQRRLDAGGCVIDARAAARFRGEEETIDRVAGHVPGALNRPYTENLENGVFKPPARLADEFRQLLDGCPPTETVVMCGSGVTACHHLLAMERAGLHGAALYTGSWSGWIGDRSRPVAAGAH
ncbi:MAG: sulfurtransferase [Pseudoxanthomonas suwonensis]|nr:sulfurtransferase [Pseudoxanthomonas suwonensis]